MSLTDQEVIEQRNDAEMMRRPHLWSTGSYLPLKRPKGNGLPQVAVLEHQGWTFVVHENMTIMGTSLGEEVTVHRFQDAEDVVAAGWLVD